MSCCGSPIRTPHIDRLAERFRGQSLQGIYGGVRAELDWSVGELLTALKRTGAEANTPVGFSSGNGPCYQASAGPPRGRKGATSEGGMRVPFLERFPGRIRRGRVSHGVAAVMDLHPTICQVGLYSRFGAGKKRHDVRAVKWIPAGSAAKGVPLFRRSQRAVRSGWASGSCTLPATT